MNIVLHNKVHIWTHYRIIKLSPTTFFIVCHNGASVGDFTVDGKILDFALCT